MHTTQVTEKIKALVVDGALEIHGGVSSVLGDADPEPGVLAKTTKMFRCKYTIMLPPRAPPPRSNRWDCASYLERGNCGCSNETHNATAHWRCSSVACNNLDESYDLCGSCYDERVKVSPYVHAVRAIPSVPSLNPLSLGPLMRPPPPAPQPGGD